MSVLQFLNLHFVISSQPHLGSLYGTPSGMQSPGPHQSNFYGSGIPGSGIYRFFFRLHNLVGSALDSVTLNQPTLLMEQYYCTLEHVLNMKFAFILKYIISSFGLSNSIPKHATFQNKSTFLFKI